MNDLESEHIVTVDQSDPNRGRYDPERVGKKKAEQRELLNRVAKNPDAEDWCVVARTETVTLRAMTGNEAQCKAVARSIIGQSIGADGQPPSRVVDAWAEALVIVPHVELPDPVGEVRDE